MEGASSSKICRNIMCENTSITRWTEGWKISSGEKVDLCNICGHLFAIGQFCLSFHQDQDGWTKCDRCTRPIHCGCIVSASSYIFADVGGVLCLDCANRSSKSNDEDPSPPRVFGSMNPNQAEKEKDGDTMEKKNKRTGAGETSMKYEDGVKLLRPRGKPTVVVIEGQEFEEYDQLPLLVIPSAENTNTESDNPGDQNKDLVLATSKHPRHRVGCACVTCVQNPKGNPHPLDCNCKGCEIHRRRRQNKLENLKQKRRK